MDAGFCLLLAESGYSGLPPERSPERFSKGDGLMATVDRIFSILIILAGAVHAAGSLKYYEDPLTVLWALCATLFIFLFGAINLLRASRRGDKPLAWICLVSGLVWILAAVRFGYISDRMADMHVLVVIVVTVVICAFNVGALVTANKR
jgi:hypothetical protein